MSAVADSRGSPAPLALVWIAELPARQDLVLEDKEVGQRGPVAVSI